MKVVELSVMVDEDGAKCWYWTCPNCGVGQVEYLDEQSQVLCSECDTYFEYEIKEA